MPQLVSTKPVDVAEVEPTYVPEWRERTIVFRHRSGRVFALDAWQHGTLWLHATWDDSDARPFTITHKPSMLSVAKLNDVDEAVAKVEWLWQRCPATWSRDDVDKASLPDDVAAWLMENKR